jgi:hypothetical protein
VVRAASAVMTVKRKPRKPKYAYDVRVAGAIFAILIVALLLMYFFGAPPAEIE